MTDDLFANLPPMKSPRLIWMEEHGITTHTAISSIGKGYVAECTPAGKAIPIRTKADNEHDALVELAIKLNIKLWNQ